MREMRIEKEKSCGTQSCNSEQHSYTTISVQLNSQSTQDDYEEEEQTNSDIPRRMIISVISNSFGRLLSPDSPLQSLLARLSESGWMCYTTELHHLLYD